MGVHEHYTTLLYLSLTLGIVTPCLDLFLSPSPTSAIVDAEDHLWFVEGFDRKWAFFGVPRVNRESAYAEQCQPEFDLLPPRLSRYSDTGQVISLPFLAGTRTPHRLCDNPSSI
ncbi:hypothetical protein N7G274_002757 [Stereocaulon virgatum]|uniref:Uncharacterized protein n=1 Tax=Stereocaulon virgatum TaxID=373712 RepID=A0ABR4AGQ7_9LECA